MFNFIYNIPIMKNKKVDLILKIEGEKIEEEGIDVFVLIPALLSIGNVIKESNKLINKLDKNIIINIKPLTKGSIDIELLLKVYSVLKQLWNSSDAIIEVLQNLGLIIGSVPGIQTGLIQLIKFLKGKPKNIEKTIENNYKFTNTDGDITVINGNVYNLYADPNIRKNMRGFTKILEQNNVKKIESYIKNKPETKETISKEHGIIMQDFSESSIEEFENISERIIFLKPKRVSLEGEHGNWSFRYSEKDGETITVNMKDEIFLKKVKLGEISLNNLDLYKVRLRERQIIIDNEVVESQKEIIEVMEVNQKPLQADLFQRYD